MARCPFGIYIYLVTVCFVVGGMGGKGFKFYCKFGWYVHMMGYNGVCNEYTFVVSGRAKR